MFADEKYLLQLVGSLNDAAAYPDRWPEFLQLAAKAFDAKRAITMVHNGRSATRRRHFS
jgi:hypothetical protein